MTKPSINPIQWHEGMLLMPQHFQLADLRANDLLTYQISHMFPFFWGVINLEIDEALLTTGVFRPKALEAILPDGLIVTSLPEQPLELNLLPLQSKLQKKPHFVYLCIPHQRGLDEDISGDLPRYLSGISKNVVDMNTGEQAVDIPRLKPNLSLQIGLKPPEHYTALPLGEVSFDAKSFALTNYIPPQVNVKPTSALGKICGDLALRLRQKLGYLQQKVQAVGQRVKKDPFFQELEGIRLKILSGLLPFEAVLSIEKVHPSTIYQVLCGLAGYISGVKYGEIPPRFADYNHMDIRRNFEQIMKYITDVLDEIEESYSIVSFNLDDRIYTLQLQSQWIQDRFVLGARAQPNMTEDDLSNWINNCVIVTDKFVMLAKDNRILGAERKLVSEVPSMNLVPSRDVQLFVVEADPQYIDPTGVLCLFNMSDTDLTRPTEVVLYNSNEQTLGSKD